MVVVILVIASGVRGGDFNIKIAPGLDDPGKFLKSEKGKYAVFETMPAPDKIKGVIIEIQEGLVHFENIISHITADACIGFIQSNPRWMEPLFFEKFQRKALSAPDIQDPRTLRKGVFVDEKIEHLSGD